MSNSQRPVLLAGNNRLTFSIAACLLKAGCHVFVSTDKDKELKSYLSGESVNEKTEICGEIILLKDLKDLPAVDFAVVITPENSGAKKDSIKSLDKYLPADTVIAVNSESFPLKELQQELQHPARLVVANWSEPAQTTLFLELVTNSLTDKSLVGELEVFVRDDLKKDPYTVSGELGYRGRLIASLVREAFYLVENDYANFEDIDRACRNDSGYYLPFSGNLRYMDLMGTYAYGMVMKDLNPQLANSPVVPGSLREKLKSGYTGMESGKGFFTYEHGDAERWNELIRKFGGEVKELMEKYPFNYQLESKE